MTSVVSLDGLRRSLRARDRDAPAPGLATDRGAVPLSVYVHLPWCIRKCPYCDFNSHAVTAQAPLDAAAEARYCDALEAELDAMLGRVWGRTVQTVFIGGGTPSLFSPESIGRILSTLRARLRLVPGAEITMEANPGTFERARFEGFRAAGITRLSLGVQSFDDRCLTALGRVHDGAAAREAAGAAAELFDTFNLDLMVGLPGQDLAMLQADVHTALSFAPPHLSLYQLTIEPNTRFAHDPPVLPDDDESDAMQQHVDDVATRSGLQHYETSAWARPGHRCAHNLNYWGFGDYLGLGAGAHSKLSSTAGIVRRAALRHPQQYVRAALAGDAAADEHAVLARDLPFEFMMNALRLRDGVPAAWFAERTGLDPAVMGPVVRRAVERGLLDADPSSYRATALGARFLNDLLQMFLPDGRD